MLYNVTVRPSRGQVLVSEIDAPTKTPGGLHVVTNGKARRSMSDEEVEAAFSTLARVEAMGPEPLQDSGQPFPLDGLQIGDVVVVHKGYGGVPLILDGRRMMFLPYGAVLATIPDYPHEPAEAAK